MTTSLRKMYDRDGRLLGPGVDFAVWAVDRGTPYAERLCADVANWTRDFVDQMRADIDVLCGRAVQGGWSASEAEAWVLVCVCAPDLNSAFGLSGLLSGDAVHDRQRAFEQWKSVGTWAPWAYAAGLTPTEAQAHRVAGTLGRDRLLMLAGLRGWMFPPLA